MKKIVSILFIIAVLLTLVACSNVKNYEMSNLNVGDTFVLGNYNDKAIEWQVLDKEDDKILVITKDIVAVMPYQSSMQPLNDDICWENCQLREWLNDSFYKSAFNRTEKSKIQTTLLMNKDINMSSLYYSNDTFDKVFLLSGADVEKYFENKKDRLVPNQTQDESYWWLRMPYYDAEYDMTYQATWVDFSGFIAGLPNDESGAFYMSLGVRPAMWIEID